MKRVLLLCVTLVFVLTSCVSVQENETEDVVSTVTAEDLLQSMTDQEKCWMDLTSEQYLEDFDILYKELQNNYPYFGVAQRKYNVNIDSQYSLYRKQISACKNDYDYYNLICNFVAELEYTGHIDLWGTRYTSELESLMSFIQEFPENKETLTLYLNKLENTVSQKNYQAMENFYEELQRTVDEQNKHMENSTLDNVDSSKEEEIENFDNVTTNIIQEREIAYVKVESFDMDYFKQDKEILLPFYKSVQDYDHIIIDISNNPGGGMDYFNQLIVAPLAQKTYCVSTFLLVKGGENNKYFLEIPEGIKSKKWRPVTQLPSLSNMNQEDLAMLDYFMEEKYTVSPNDQQGFHGHIWLLVSENNYSSSEYAAMFSKQSGFTTLVGERTGGDGIGVDPVYIILPNSGLVVQYSPIYGVTSDGKSSEEYGTEPDYYRKEGESALDTCLQLIHDGSN